MGKLNKEIEKENRKIKGKRKKKQLRRAANISNSIFVERARERER